MIYSPEQVAAKDLSNLQTMVTYGEDMTLHGSFSQRNPHLGKMVRCLCGRRHRQAVKCCNIDYAKDEDNKILMMKNPIGKRLLRRFKHKRHGQTRTRAIRNLTIRMQQDPELVQFAANEMHIKKPEVAAIPAFAERYFLWREDRQQKKFRRQSDLSRRINAGLVIGRTSPVAGNLRPLVQREEKA